MLQRPHFLPKVSPSSVAQTAHCVRIIFYVVESRGGQPYDAKSLSTKAGLRLVPIRTLARSGAENSVESAR